MIQIAVIDDDPEERRKERELLEKFAGQEQLLIRIEEYSSGRSFLARYNGEVDIILLDIEMPGMDGMETAKAIRETDPSVLLIFVTNLAQYALFGYEVEALDFMVKPVDYASFALKMKRAVSRPTKRAEEWIPVRQERETRQVPVSHIRYLEVSGHYVCYHTTEGNLTEYITMKEAEKKINRSYFVRCNQSYLVNLRFITAVTKDTVFVGEEELAFSRPQKKVFLAAYSEFLGGRIE